MLVQRNFSVVFRFFTTKVTDGAEDLTQKTFLVALEHADRLRRDVSFRAFLLGVARNVLLHHWREQGRSGPGGGIPEADPGLPPDIVVEKEEQRILLKALRRIPLDYQIVIELYYWEEMGVAEVAAVLGVPSGTVKARLHRARGRLRRAIEALAEDPAVIESTVGNLERWAASLRRSVRSREPDDSE